jgi:hypothetical protein
MLETASVFKSIVNFGFGNLSYCENPFRIFSNSVNAVILIKLGFRHFQMDPILIPYIPTLYILSLYRSEEHVRKAVFRLKPSICQMEAVNLSDEAVNPSGKAVNPSEGFL